MRAGTVRVKVRPPLPMPRAGRDPGRLRRPDQGGTGTRASDLLQKRPFPWLLALSILLFADGAARARIDVAHYLPEDFDHADVVCKATIVSVTPAGKGEVPGSCPQERVHVTINVTGTIKEELAVGPVKVLGAKSPFQTVKLWGTGRWPFERAIRIPSEEPFLFFLARSDQGLAFHGDPNCVPASAGKVDYSKAEGARDRLRLELVAALESGPRDAMLAAILGIGDMKFARLSDRLRKLCASDDADVVWRALVARTRLGDADALEELIGWFPRAPTTARRAAEAKLTRDVFTRKPAKSLRTGAEKLAGSDNVLLRFATVYALRHIGNESSLPILVRALDDENFDTRFSAVHGLAVIAGKLDHAPAHRMFKENEQKYLGFWKEWWREEGKSRHGARGR